PGGCRRLITSVKQTHGRPERRKRAESALITVVADCYLAGVSTRRMDKLVRQLGIDSLSKSQVSRMATELDEHIEAFR
ncbi:transposase, partial [Staphylococcus haemolyticus]